MIALRRQAEEGGSWLVRVSLAQTGEFLTRLGRLEGGLSVPDQTPADIGDLLEAGAENAAKRLGFRLVVCRDTQAERNDQVDLARLGVRVAQRCGYRRGDPPSLWIGLEVPRRPVHCL